jgi:sugar lactone lactonase YvrE
MVVLAACSASAAADSLYVSDNSLFTVEVFDAHTGAFTGQLTPQGGWGLPTGIAVASDGTVYVADNYNNVVYRFNADGTFRDTFASAGLFEPTGIAFGPDGYLYVANFGSGNNSYIVRFNSSGALVDASPFVPSSTNLYDPEAIPEAIAFQPSGGSLFIADSSNATIDKVVLPAGTFSTLIPAGCPTTPFINPEGVAFGPDQNLYVSDAGFGCADPSVPGGSADSGVYKYDINGNFLGSFIAPNILSTPIDLVFGPDGDLYVTDSGARVARFNGTTGAELPDFVASGGSAGPLIGPTFLAFSESAAAKIAATSGSGQSATTNTAFASPLVATVTDLAGNPVAGITVTFTTPSTGASATLTGGNTAVTNAAGVATSNALVANGTAGPWNVIAISGSAIPATFSLTNTAPVPPANVSSKVSVIETGFAVNRVTHLWTSTMTLTNKGGTSIDGPVQVVLTGLTSGVMMTNATGMYNTSPYITVSSADIAPGGSVSVAIQFSNPSNLLIVFTPVTYSGTLGP